MITNNIKKIRLQKGLSQQAAATAVGIGIRIFQYYEAGEKSPSVYVALRIARALDTTVEELFPIEEEK